MPLAKSDFSPNRESLFRRHLFPSTLSHSQPQPQIDPHELLLRSILALWWAIGTYLGLNLCHAILSLFFVVILRTDNPSDWPALYGPLSEITSLRTFWSKFWHRIVVRSYSNYGLAFSRGGLRLKRGSKGEGLVMIFGVFFLSGLAHGVVARVLGQEERWREFRDGVGGRLMGRVWVFFFFFWTVPKWLYPKIDCAIEDALVAQAGGG